MTVDWLVPVATLVFGGGIAGSITALFRARPEREAVVASGAEQAVVSMGKSLDAMERRCGIAERRADKLEAELEALEARFSKIQQELAIALDELRTFRQQRQGST